MFKQRLITAVVMSAVFLGVLLLAPVPVFYLFVTGIVALGAWEWANLSNFTSVRSKALYTAGLVVLMMVLWMWQRLVEPLALQYILLGSAVAWGVALLWVQSYPSSAVLWRPRPVRALMGLMVLVPAWLSLIYLRSFMQGEWLVLAVILLVAAADIGAYCAGRAFGKRKLAPAVSPGKTWEGVGGGVLAAALVAAVYVVSAQPDSYWLPILIAIPTALVSVLGDLFESMLKRFRGVKDSSGLLPGHGGVLDRIDGLAAALPIFTLAVVSSGGRLMGL